MTNPIYYNRVVTSTVQGDGYGVIEPNGTLVVANGGELRLHDGSTAGGNEITGSGGGIPLTGATYDLNSGADLVINTTSGAINLLNNAVAGVEISDVVRIYSNNIYSEMRSNGNFAIPGTLENANATTGNVTINTNDGTTSRTWTFGQDGSLSVPQSPSGAGQITGGSNGIQLIANSHAWGFGTDASLSLPGTATGASGVLNLSDDSNVSITAGSTYGFFIATNGGGNGQPQWGFANDGSTQFPHYTFPSADGTSGQVLATNGSGTLSWTSAGSGSTGPFTLGTGSEDSTTYDMISVASGENIWINADTAKVMLGGTNVRLIVDDGNNNFYISYSDEGLTAGIPDSGNYYHWKFSGNDNTLEMPYNGAFKPNGAANSNQILKLVPTNSEQGDHIHLVSGNLGQTSIFLGNDNQYIRTNIDGSMVIGTDDSIPDQANSGYRWTFGADGKLSLPRNNVITAEGNAQVGYYLTVTEDTVLIQTTGEEGTDNAFITWSDSATSFITQIWTPFCVGAPDSIVGWTLTAADNTVSNIIGANNYGLAYTIKTDRYSIGPAPFVFQSPNYVAASDNTVNIKAADKHWTFGTDGILTVPASSTIHAADNGIISIPYIQSTGISVAQINGLGTSSLTLQVNNNNFVLNANGSMSFPSGGTFSVGNIPVHSTGASGDKAGTIAFSPSHLYYCLVDYGNTTPINYTSNTGEGTDQYSRIVLKLSTGGAYPDLTGYTITGSGISGTVKVTGPSYPTGIDGDTYFPVDTAFYQSAGTYTFTPPTDIWKRIAWSADTW